MFLQKKIFFTVFIFLHKNIQIANFLIFSYTKHTQTSNFCLNIKLFNKTYVLIGVTILKGITKVIDEMGLMILTKEIELEMKREEIDELKKKIELIEGYLEIYDEFYNKAN